MHFATLAELAGQLFAAGRRSVSQAQLRCLYLAVIAVPLGRTGCSSTLSRIVCSWRAYSSRSGHISRRRRRRRRCHRRSIIYSAHIAELWIKPQSPPARRCQVVHMADWQLNRDFDLAQRELLAANDRVVECYQLEHAARARAHLAGLNFERVQRRGLILSWEGRDADSQQLGTLALLYHAMGARYDKRLQALIQSRVYGRAEAACLSAGMISEHEPG